MIQVFHKIDGTTYTIVGCISDNPNLIQKDLEKLAKTTRELAIGDILLYEDEFYYIGEKDISPVEIIFSLESYSLI